jgi:hypothetical protein
MKRFTVLICLFSLLLLVPAGLAEVPNTEAPHLFSISPTSMTNPGSVTVTLSGSGFVPGATARMTPCNGPGYADGVVTILGSQQATARFSLSVGQWKLRLTNPDGDVTEVKYFIVGGSTTDPTTTTASSTTTTTHTTTTTIPASSGKNSIFFETNPTGATIILDGKEVGTSAFKYYTDEDGVFNVLVKKIGYDDYEGKVTVVDGGAMARFYAKLEPLSSSSGSVTATPAPSGSSSSATTPVSTATTIRKSTLKMPTPLGTDPPLPAEESPVDPSLALLAAGIAAMVVVIRRR